MQRRHVLWLVVSIVLLSACASVSPQAPEAEPVTVRVAVMQSLSHAPVFIADEEGYFAEEKLDVKFVFLRRSSEALAAVAQGEVDVVLGSLYPGHLNAIARGGNIKFVADKGHYDPEGCAFGALVVGNALIDAGVLQDSTLLEGCSVGANAASFSGYLLTHALAIAGMDLDDVLVENPPAAAKYDATCDGTLDASLSFEPWLTRMLDEGEAAIWLTVQEAVPEFQHGVLTYGPVLLEENTDAGERFMVAYLKAVRQYNLGKTPRNVEILSKRLEWDADELGKMCWLPFRDNGQIDVQSVLDFQAWALELGLLDEALEVDEFWDARFVEHANQVLGTPSG